MGERIEYSVRELEADLLRTQYESFKETLKNLRDVEDLPVERAVEILADINSQGSHIYVACLETGEIIGATTLMIEQKFIRAGGKVGHIEDVATREGYEGKGIGSAVMKKAIEKAVEEGCYKVILDCAEHNVRFYEKFDFKRYEVCMRRDS